MRGAATPAAPAAPLAAPVPWYVAATLVAATSAKVGIIWDISWHRSIGRDTFWTPAHAAIYLGGVLAGLACGWLVLRMSFAGTAEQRAATVGFWGFRGALGAWVCIWGALAMITCAQVDNWWHNAYGGDAEALPRLECCPAHGLAAVPVAARGPGRGERPVDAACRSGSRLAAGGAGGTRVPRGVLRDPVVLHRVSAQSAQPQLSVRRRSLGLFESPGAVALPLLARRDRSGDAAGRGDRRGARRALRPARAVVGELDGQAAAMTGRGLRLGALVGIALVASAHVGSPDTYFEGAAGPYPVRVIVRNPGVVPGLAQITVRLLALPPRAVRRVLVLPAFWAPRTAAPPPPHVATPAPA